MKLPSIRQVLQDGRETLSRFPAVIGIAVLGTGAALLLIDHEGAPRPTVLFKILLASILAIPLLTALALLSERKSRGMFRGPLLQSLGVLILILYALTVPSNLSNAPLVTLFRFFTFAVALHLLVAVAAHTTRGELNGFWHFNKTIFLRLLTAYVYSLVLFAGLAIALSALDNLFGVDVPGKRYPQLWVLTTGIFTTWFFLAGVPADLARLESVTDYPKGLKVFAQYILFPLVLVYFVILYAYLGKILVAWDWPQGWVSKLILGFSATGIFSLLLLHPITGQAENVWMKRAAQWFYIIMIPLVVMLFLAVWRRVSEYGITEGRYVALAFGVWLLFIVSYFTVSRIKSIKVIPASLCVFALAISFGPWGMFQVSEGSQIARLKGLMERTAILTEGKVRPAHGEVPYEDTQQISSILSYLHEVHGFAGIEQWFPERLTLDSAEREYKSASVVTQMMGLEFVPTWEGPRGGMITLKVDGPFEINGYEKMVRAEDIKTGSARKELPGEGISFQMSEGQDTLMFTATRDGKELLRIDVREHVTTLLKKYNTPPTAAVPAEKMSIEGRAGGLSVKLCLWQVQVRRRAQETKPMVIAADILYSVKPGM